MLATGQDLLQQNSFYASFRTVGMKQIKDALEGNGWHSRKAGCSEFELTNERSELILEGGAYEQLLHGAVVFDKAVLEALDKLFSSLGADFVYAFYDDNKHLLFEKRSAE